MGYSGDDGARSGVTMLDAALRYAARGWHVFPLEVDGKRPLGRLVPNGKDDASTDPTKIRAWWNVEPKANIGLALAPSGLVALDVDVSGDKQGKQSLREIASDLPPSTLVQRSARGGAHLIYQAPPAVPPTNRLGFKPGLDLIGIGYIVAAPSTFEGKPYSWLNEAEIAPCPALLVNAAKERAPRPRTDIGSSDAPAPVIEGGRNQALFRFGAAMRDTGADEDTVTAAILHTNLQRCKPPLPDDECMRIAASVMRSVKPTRDALTAQAIANQFDPPLRLDRPAPGAAPVSFLGDVAPVVVPASAVRLSELAKTVRPKIRTYPTLFPTLNALIGGGWLTRTLTVFLGPPGAGKTAFMVGVSLHAATSAGVPVLYVSTELESEEIRYRHAAPLLGVPWTRLERDESQDAEVARIVAPLNIHALGAECMPRPDEALTIIEREVARVASEAGVPPLVIVDYMQDLARGVEAANVRAKVGDIAMQLRVLAQAYDCVVNAVSSVSRSKYGEAKAQTLRNEDDASVYLSAAKESGDIDYAAATVLYLDVETDTGTDFRNARLCVAKARRGRTGFAGARFYGASGRWTDDPGALEVLRPDSQAKRKADESLTAIEGAILSLLAQHQALSSEEIASLVTGRTESIRKALTQLKLARKIHRATERSPWQLVAVGRVERPDPALAGWDPGKDSE